MGQVKKNSINDYSDLHIETPIFDLVIEHFLNFDAVYKPKQNLSKEVMIPHRDRLTLRVYNS